MNYPWILPGFTVALDSPLHTSCIIRFMKGTFGGFWRGSSLRSYKGYFYIGRKTSGELKALWIDQSKIIISRDFWKHGRHHVCRKGKFWLLKLRRPLECVKCVPQVSVGILKGWGRTSFGNSVKGNVEGNRFSDKPSMNIVRNDQAWGSHRLKNYDLRSDSMPNWGEGLPSSVVLWNPGRWYELRPLLQAIG